MKKTTKSRSSDEFKQSSYLSGFNDYIESLYEDFLHNPDSIEGDWKNYFLGLADGGPGVDVSHADIRESLVESAKHSVQVIASSAGSEQLKVDSLIDSYRRYGHFQSDLDAIGLNALYKPDSRLTLEFHNLSEMDLTKSFATRGLLSASEATLNDIVTKLQETYCSHIGYEFMYIDSQEEQSWFIDQVEKQLMPETLADSKKQEILASLVAAEGMEKFLDSKYPGQKRFSLEGLDTLIPMLNDLASVADDDGIKEIKVAMAHRGRLNVLVNVLGQPPQELYDVFDGNVEHGNLSGDVKYHLGYSGDVKTKNGSIHMSMLFNPSHLEFVNPVAMGAARAKRDLFNSDNKEYAMLVLLHGDAAFVGQGIVTESLNMSKTVAYDIGGTVHVITNNQVGFTNSNSECLRSSFYCTGPAKSIDAPIIHVNADYPEDAVKAMRLAYAYRKKFQKDVVVDLVGFRRHGHQEVDEPRTTQPLMYQYIDQHPGVRAKYSSELISAKLVDEKTIQELQQTVRDKLDRGASLTETIPHGLSEKYKINWAPFFNQTWDTYTETAYSKDELISLAKKLSTIPDEFNLQRNVNKIMQARVNMSEGKQNLDWGMAEMLAYSSLMKGGFNIRLVGEDVRRGTFYHRHATIVDQKSNKAYEVLDGIAKESKVDLMIEDSVLSETGALGFEYGYAMTCPNSLVVWEAQFGDFANVAQVIIDQFISSAWQKWQRLSGLVMLLPHGYEGMGPEHSSSRLERYLQLSAQGNMQICMPSTPAQMFHLLRRQMMRPFRVPLIVMTPKSMLRHKDASSSLSDLSEGGFKLVLPEAHNINPEKVKRVILCSGKIYYELLSRRTAENIDDIALLRIEQLYPFPYDVAKQEIAAFPNCKELLWCQEEPKNQGAWFLMRSRLEKIMPKDIRLMYSCRVPMAAPSAGHVSLYKKHQAEVVSRALSLDGYQPHNAVADSV